MAKRIDAINRVDEQARKSFSSLSPVALYKFKDPSDSESLKVKKKKKNLSVNILLSEVSELCSNWQAVFQIIFKIYQN